MICHKEIQRLAVNDICKFDLNTGSFIIPVPQYLLVKSQGPRPSRAKPKHQRKKRDWGLIGLSLKSYVPPPLKTKRATVTQYDHQQEGGLPHVQEEHYQSNVLRVLAIVSGPVGNAA